MDADADADALWAGGLDLCNGFGSDEVADVTGAGDTVLAVLTAALAAGANPLESARLADIAAGLVVMKLGTATISADELRTAVTGAQA